MGQAGSGAGAGAGGAGAGGSSGGAGGASAAGTGGDAGSAGAGSGAVDCSAAADECPFANGLSHACKKRFALGVNYAWHHFGGDFGGVPAWSLKGVSEIPDEYDAELATMRANGVSVVRWWMFPDFRGAGVEFDADNNPTGLSATAVADIEMALELAEKNDLNLVLTIFSFDNFRKDATSAGVLVRGMSPMVSSATRRAKLVENVVRPVARAVANSEHASRLLGWDLMNEPEWAIAATGRVEQDFGDNAADITAVTLDDMKSLFAEGLAVLKEETPQALRSIGWAAAKWSWAFQDVDVDFHQPHIYGWVNDYWPYTQTPAQLGYGAKPTVMGEVHLLPMPFADSGEQDTLQEVLESWYSNGYAGAWPWQYIETDYAANLGEIDTFAKTHACETTF
jgi:hypothetical protein